MPHGKAMPMASRDVICSHVEPNDAVAACGGGMVNVGMVMDRCWSLDVFKKKDNRRTTAFDDKWSNLIDFWITPILGNIHSRSNQCTGIGKNVYATSHQRSGDDWSIPIGRINESHSQSVGSLKQSIVSNIFEDCVSLLKPCNTLYLYISYF